MIGPHTGRHRRGHTNGVRHLFVIQPQKLPGGDRRPEDADCAAGVKSAPTREVVGIDRLGYLHLHLKAQDERSQELLCRDVQVFADRKTSRKRLNGRVNEDGPIFFLGQRRVVEIQRMARHSVDLGRDVKRHAHAVFAKCTRLFGATDLAGEFAEDVGCRFLRASHHASSAIHDAAFRDLDGFARKVCIVGVEGEFHQFVGDAVLGGLVKSHE